MDVQELADHQELIHNCSVQTQDTYPIFAGPSGIRAGWGIEINGRFEAERPPALAGPPLGGQTGTLTPLSPKYSTGPCCLV